MLDPYKIPRPGMFPERSPAYLTNRSEGRLAPTHVHIAYVDAQGNGSTSISCSHFHRIVGGAILPDESDSHAHGLTNIPAGAGI
jgi:hypothetical protein